MKRTIVFSLILLLTTSTFAQTVPRYEVEMLGNPNAGRKDTRELNGVLEFEADSIRIRSRRGKGMFKEFRYSDIRTVEHAYSSKSPFRISRAGIVALTVLTASPILLLLAREREKHWLMVATDDDYAVLKIENDNYRLIRMEFIVKKVGIVDIDENH